MTTLVLPQALGGPYSNMKPFDRENQSLPNRRPTIDDVAALSGVARVTVSRVLNGGPNVRPQVREKVMAAVEALQYRVNVQAQRLAARSSWTLAMVVEASHDAEPNSFYH